MLLLTIAPETMSIIFEFCIVPILALVTGFIVTWLNAKRKEVLAKTDNEVAQKLINITTDIINSAVISTTETYVKSMKNQNLFDLEAQKTALDKTKTMVMDTLSSEAKTQLTNLYGDLEKYLESKIEEAIKNNK